MSKRQSVLESVRLTENELITRKSSLRAPRGASETTDQSLVNDLVDNIEATDEDPMTKNDKFSSLVHRGDLGEAYLAELKSLTEGLAESFDDEDNEAEWDAAREEAIAEIENRNRLQGAFEDHVRAIHGLEPNPPRFPHRHMYKRTYH